jgi:hypothetical protein
LVPERINYAIPIDEAKHLIRKAYPFGIEQLERRCRDCASPFAAALPLFNRVAWSFAC